MKMLTILCCLALLLMGCSTTTPAISISAKAFPIKAFESRKFKKGAATHGEFGVQFGGVAQDDFIRLSGQWSDPSFEKCDLSGKYYGGAAYRDWSIEIHPKATAREETAIINARDGYAADLGYALNASARIYPRFERKTFPWGKAVSFLVQYQNDNTNYVPNNGMLTYEVHGLTQDGRYIRASFGVTHKSLSEFGPEVRDHRDGDPADPNSPMRKDPHYRLVESAAASSFEPSLAEIDNFIGTLSMGE